MVTVSKNLQVRINLARENLNHIQVSLANGYNVSRSKIKEVRNELATCRKLLRKELSDVKDISQLISY
jgi:hypothetical protein